MKLERSIRTFYEAVIVGHQDVEFARTGEDAKTEGMIFYVIRQDDPHPDADCGHGGLPLLQYGRIAGDGE
jgi:hypothetical protein